jgi:hypothetical protein
MELFYAGSIHSPKKYQLLFNPDNAMKKAKSFPAMAFSGAIMTCAGGRLSAPS